MSAVARAAARAVLTLAATAAVLWAATGAPGLREAFRLAVMSAVVGAAAAGVTMLGKRG